MAKLLDGYYKATNSFFFYLEVKDGKTIAVDNVGNRITMNIEYGNLGPADALIKEQTGKDEYNITLQMVYTPELPEGWKDLAEKFKDSGVLSEDGKRCVLKNAFGVCEYIKITDEEWKAMEDNFDDIEAPPGPYKLQPENQGKLIWFSGAPGMGKSTTAQILARENGYVYYEADCFGMLKNPYIPLDVENPSMYQLKMKSLKGPGADERRALSKLMHELLGPIMQGKEFDNGKFIQIYKAMSEDIRKEKERIGGDWAVAHVVLKRESRDLIREILGPQLIFVILSMPKEDRQKRIKGRHFGDENASHMMDVFEKQCEPGQEGEPNTINVSVTGDMTREQVVEEVQRQLKAMEANQIRLQDGFYKVNDSFAQSWKIEGDGEKISIKDPFDAFDMKPTLKYGDFGAVSEKMETLVGKARYNMKLSSTWGMEEMDENGEMKPVYFHDYGVITDEGTRCTLKSISNYSVEKITEKQLMEIENDFDPIEAPPGPYKLQPGKKGKLLWFSGAPGMGKSTSAQLLARDNGYVYYEADAFNMMHNPFNPLDSENPSVETIKQKVLKGPGAAERSKLVQKASTIWGKLMSGQEYDKEVIRNYYIEMCNDITKQKERIGGDWAIAHVVFSREIRDMMRKMLGPDLIFIVLTMSKEDKNKRLMNRHDGDLQFVEFLESFEKIMEDNDDKSVPEPNTITVTVTGEMTRKQVVEEVQKKIKEMEDNQIKLLDGVYKVNDSFVQSWRVEGEKIVVKDPFDAFDLMPSMEYGDFGAVSEKMETLVGKGRYNMKLSYTWGLEEKDENGEMKPIFYHDYGVIKDGGTKCYLKGLLQYSVEKITEEQLIEIENDFDPIEAPPGPYKLQPEKKGKLLWFSGAPGMGKSTSAQLLARDNGYVYYEADAFNMMHNPFNSLDSENPSMDTVKQKILKGPGAAERSELVQKAQSLWGKLMSGQEYDKELFKNYYKEMCKDITKQKERIGGDWAIAHVVFSREIRDMMREIFGPDLIFIVLTMSKEEKKKRLMNRHDGDLQFVELMESFEKIMEDNDDKSVPEPNTITLTVTGEMTRKQVVEEVQKQIEEMEDNQIKLLDGFYKVKDNFIQWWKVDGDSFDMKDPFEAMDFKPSLEYGDFGAVSPKLEAQIGKARYNMKITYTWGMGQKDENGELKMVPLYDYGVIKEGGKKVYMKGMVEYEVEKITEEQLIELQNDYDPIEAPPGPYKVQPEKKGKLLWFSGAPGMGKSTSAQILARDHGYVYYEADAFGGMLNPFNPLDSDNPSMSTAKQKTLKGPGAKERAELVRKVQDVWGPLMAGLEYDKELLLEYYVALCEDINKQKERIGGDWAVAHVVLSKEVRDTLRRILGPDLVIIILTMSKEAKNARLKHRHDGNLQFVEMMEVFENLMDAPDQMCDEQNFCITIEVEADETREDVVEKIRKVVSKL